MLHLRRQVRHPSDADRAHQERARAAQAQADVKDLPAEVRQVCAQRGSEAQLRQKAFLKDYVTFLWCYECHLMYSCAF